MIIRLLLAFILAVSAGCSFAADQKISAMTDGGAVQATDKIPAVRAGANIKVSTGTIAAQDADDVNLTGGLIDGVSIGQNVPTDGTFNYLDVQGYSVHQLIQTPYIYIQSPRVGTFTCNGTTPVVKSTIGVNSDSVILITLKTSGGTQGAAPTVTAKSQSISFTVVCTAGDTGIYNYVIIN